MFRDVIHACRTIFRMPVLSTVVVVSLGIGIGVNTVVFSWLQSRVFQPLPGVVDGASFHLIEPRGENNTYPGTSWLEYQDLQERLPSFRDVIAFRMVPFNVGAADQLERTSGLLVSGNYFSGLGVQPALGRLLDPGDVARPGGEPVVVISHNFWQTRFSGASSVLGQTLRVNDRLVTIVGVTPDEFVGTAMGLTFDLWAPAMLAPVLLDGSRELENRGIRGYSAIGRLRSEAGVRQAQGDLDAAMRQFANDYPESNATLQGEVLPFWKAPRGPQRFMVTALAILQAVMLLLLLAVCGNTANLMLARASARQREISVRVALGAGRWRIVSSLLSESLVLSLLGAALGIAIAFWGTDALRAVPLPTPGGFSLKFYTPVDMASLAFATILGLVSGLIFGLAPALHLARVAPQLSLRDVAHTAGRSRLRDALMAIEVALALVVLIAAAVFLKNFNETRSTDPGFRREGILLAAYDLSSRNRSVDPVAARDFARRLLDDVRALPTVEAAAIASAVPLDIHGLASRSFILEGRARADGSLDQALTNIVSPGYFTALGIPFLGGMDFANLGDTDSTPQAIVNEAFVRKYLENAAVLGRNLETAGRRYTIVGVVKTSFYNAFGEPPTPFIYLSSRDRPLANGELHVRTRTGSEALLVSDIRRIVRELDPTLPVYNVRTLAEHVETNLVFRRIPARMFVVLGPLLLALAAIGIYAVVAYTVSQRTLEIGMRLALGATAPRVVRQLVGETLRVVGLGASVGMLIAFGIILHLADREATNVALLAAVPAILIFVATVACWFPSWRATKMDPIASLRQQ